MLDANRIDDSELLVPQYAHLRREALRASAARETALHRAADKAGARFEVAVRFAFTRARTELKKLLQAKKVVNYTSAIKMLQKELDTFVPQRLADMVIAGGQAGAVMLRTAEDFRAAKRIGKKIGPIVLTFDADRPEAVDWADRHAAELITQVTETTRERINNAVAEYLETADWDAFYDEMVESVGEERAYTIARHEPMVAVHEGQREAWAQAEEEGLLTGSERVTWIITDDDKVCPICTELDGKTRALDGQYKTPDGEFDGPPAHVQCRCTEGLV